MLVSLTDFLGRYRQQTQLPTINLVGKRDQPRVTIVVQFKPPKDFEEKFGLGRLEFREWVTKEGAVPPGPPPYSAWTTVDMATGEATLCVNGEGLPLMDDDVTAQIKKRRSWGILFFQHHR